MEQMIGDGAGRNPLEAWFWEMPICTRWWTTATVLTSALVQCQMVSPFQLFYSVRTVFGKGEVSSFALCGTPVFRLFRSTSFPLLRPSAEPH